MVKPIAKFSFMEEWKEYQLKDVTTILGDGLHGTPKYDENGTVFFINGNNLVDGKIEIKDSTKRVSEYEANKYRKNLTPRTILVSINGTIGNVAKYKGEACILGKSACYFNVADNFDLNFIYYVIASQQFKDTITHLATGTTIKNVSLETMRNYSFMAPSINEQKRISSILSSFDDKIELNRRINDNLEQQAQALFKSWFVDFEPFKDGEFVDSELGMIPKGWRVVCLGEVTKQVTEKVGNREDVTVLSPVNSGELVLSEEYFTKQVFSKNLSKYLIVNPLSFAYNPARINIGSIGLNEYDFVGCVSPVYVVFKCEPNYHYFFDFYKRTAVFKDEVALRAIGGVRQSLGYDDFSLIKTIYPTPDVVAEFNNLYLKMKEVITRNDIQNNKLTTLRDSLLPKLMSGELKINNFNR